jgi:hypothetical protein
MDEGASIARFPTFYVDDSACDIAGKKHVILSALTFPDEQKAIADWLAKKQKLGLHPYDEVKWNDRTSPLDLRTAFVPLLNNSIGIIVLDDSTKQAAAERLCTQIWQYCHDEKMDRISSPVRQRHYWRPAAPKGSSKGFLSSLCRVE